MKKPRPLHTGPIRVAGARLMLLLTTSFLFASTAVLALESLGFEILPRA
jgi:hypothetical protein